MLPLFLTAISCSGNDEWNQLPEPIAEFISQYFPQEGVSSTGYNGTTYHVKLKNSAGLSFDNAYKWVSINGYGSTLPAILLFDQLPPALYEYLQENEYTEQVYSVTRDASAYTISLANSIVTYNISTGKVSQSFAS